MAVTHKDLEEYYQRLNNDELERLLHSGELTALASQVAADELRHRGIVLDADKPKDQKDEEPGLADIDTDDQEEAAEAQDGSGDLVLLARYNSPIEAEMARGRLGAEGIFAVVADAQIIQMVSVMSYALGGVRVLVRPPDVALARAILGSL